MKKTKRIKASNMPSKLPVDATAITYLLLENFDAAGWIWGACGVVIIFLWAIQIYSVCTAEYIDIFEK